MAESPTSTGSPSARAEPRPRPLSPHLQVYRWPITMAMSILHRATGIALYAGTLLLVWWLVAAATGPQAYGTAQWFFGTPIGILVLLGYTWTLMHHMLGGLRHLVWDMGYGLGAADRNRLAQANLIGSIGLTILIWVVGYWLLGGNT